MEKKYYQVERTAYEKGYRVADNGIVISPRGKAMKPLKVASGRAYQKIIVSVSNGDGTFNFLNVLVHRLMAYQKYKDDIYKEGIEVRHLDGNAANNSFDNIAIGTHKENEADKSIESRQKCMLARKAKIFSENDIRYIKVARCVGLGMRKIAEHFGVRVSTIYALCSRLAI